MQRFGRGIKSTNNGIIRQHALQVDIDLKKVADRVCIFRLVQSPHDGATVCPLSNVLGINNLPVNPIEQFLRFRLVGTRLVGRRHRAGPELLGNLEPLASILRLAKIA